MDFLVDDLLVELVCLVDDGCLTLVLCREFEVQTQRILIKYYRQCSFLREFVIILMVLYYVSFIVEEKSKMIQTQVISKLAEYLSSIFSKYLEQDNF